MATLAELQTARDAILTRLSVIRGQGDVIMPGDIRSAHEATTARLERDLRMINTEIAAKSGRIPMTVHGLDNPG